MARGHIRRRGNGGLQAVVHAGVDPVTKRQQYLYETAATYKQAERALTCLLGQVDERRAPKTRATLRYVLDRWLEVADLELSTRQTYFDYVERTIRPARGEVQVRKLNADVLDRFYLHLRKHGGKCQRCWRRVRAGERYQPRPGATPGGAPARLRPPPPACVTLHPGGLDGTPAPRPPSTPPPRSAQSSTTASTPSRGPPLGPGRQRHRPAARLNKTAERLGRRCGPARRGVQGRWHCEDWPWASPGTV